MFVPRKIALVDFDGVVLRNTQAQRYMMERVEGFVEKRMRFRNPKMLQKFNAELYQTYGHTLIGLRNMGVNASLKEFNQYLYTDIDPTLMLTKEEKIQWDIFYHMMMYLGIPIYFFSNASREWCAHFVDPNVYKVGFVQDEWNGLHDDMRIQLLKPDEMVYTMMKTQYPKAHFLYWEDKLVNFKHITNDPQWTKIWVNGGASFPARCLANGLWTVPSIDIMPPV